VVSPAEAVINVNLKDQTGQVLRTLTRAKKSYQDRFGLEDAASTLWKSRAVVRR